ncbi:MAG: hypothetical protein U0984_13140 [Prosthecobacter sp.]|nr:hypothetical protein [Prosthecobacter sp.]
MRRNHIVSVNFDAIDNYSHPPGEDRQIRGVSAVRAERYGSDFALAVALYAIHGRQPSAVAPRDGILSLRK